MPEGAVYVGRPTKWGNRFRIDEGFTRDEVVAEYRRFLEDPEITELVKHELAGKDLACWCPLVDKDGNRVPCHADVLLEIANPRCQGCANKIDHYCWDRGGQFWAGESSTAA